MEFIDAHLHFGGREDEILGCLDIYDELRDLGLKKVYLLCFTTFGLNFSDFIQVAPYHARPHYHPDFSDSSALLEKAKERMDGGNFIVPFLDFRIIHGDVETWLNQYMPSGYSGLKTLFIPEYDDFLQVESPSVILKVSKSNYVDWQQRAMSYGQENNLPLICHLNLHNHFEYAWEFLSNFPDLRINFRHLGFSRRKMSKLFDAFNNCYSDISGLYDHIKNNSDGYRDYIQHYKDRIMYGSDCAWNQIKKTDEYLDVVGNLTLEDACKKDLVYDVAVKFLG
jgi:hypothetical protein